MIDLSDPLNLSEHAKTRIIQQITMLKTFEVKPHIIDAVLQQDWVAVCEERKCFDAFFHTFKDWNIHRKDERQRKAKAEEDRINLLNLLSKQIPKYTVKQRHRLIIQAKGDRYKGVRLPEEVQSQDYRRHANCWNCYRHLDNYAELQCKGCGWMLCKCGACGCGRIQQFSNCPRCQIKFRHRDSFGQTPFCSWRCKSESLADYSEYLKSPEWQEHRRLRLVRDDYTCQDCGDSATEIHHLTYERIGEEALEDLISLCKSCHLIRHNLSRLTHPQTESFLNYFH